MSHDYHVTDWIYISNMQRSYLVTIMLNQSSFTNEKISNELHFRVWVVLTAENSEVGR